MNHGKLVPEKPRTIKVVVERNVTYTKVVTVTLNHEEDNGDAQKKAIGAAQVSEDGFVKMNERFHVNQMIDITDEMPDPEVIEL